MSEPEGTESDTSNVALFPMMEGAPCVVRVHSIDVMATVYRDAVGMVYVERPVMLKYEVTSHPIIDDEGNEFTREVSGYRPMKWVPLSDATIIAVLPSNVTLIAALGESYRTQYLEWIAKLYPSEVIKVEEGPEPLAADQDRTALQTFIFDSFQPTGVIH